jgi:hypothetical protein
MFCVLFMQGMFWTMRMGLLTAGMVVAVMVMSMLSMYMLMAVVPLTMVNVFWSRGTCWSRRGCSTRTCWTCHCHCPFLFFFELLELLLIASAEHTAWIAKLLFGLLFQVIEATCGCILRLLGVLLTARNLLGELIDGLVYLLLCLLFDSSIRVLAALLLPRATLLALLLEPLILVALLPILALVIATLLAVAALIRATLLVLLLRPLILSALLTIAALITLLTVTALIALLALLL